MVMAGVHTTRALLVHLAHRLLRDRDLFERVTAERDLVAPLVEESLRHDAPGAGHHPPLHPQGRA